MSLEVRLHVMRGDWAHLERCGVWHGAEVLAVLLGPVEDLPFFDVLEAARSRVAKQGHYGLVTSRWTPELYDAVQFLQVLSDELSEDLARKARDVADKAISPYIIRDGLGQWLALLSVDTVVRSLEDTPASLRSGRITLALSSLRLCRKVYVESMLRVVPFCF